MTLAPASVFVDRAVDTQAWDGNAALTACKTAADYDSICAGRKAGDPSLRASHALPHHYLGKGPNADGTRAALQRFSQTQGLTNQAEARSHLEAHMRTVQAQEAAALPTENLFRAIYPGVEVREASDGRPVLHGHFARFNEWTEIDSIFEGRFMERIAPGAFTSSFAALTPKVLFQHGRDPEVGDKILGSPVTVSEDDVGAAYDVPLFPSVPGLIVDGLRAGAYGASFRFGVNGEDVLRKPERSDYNPEGLPERTITEASVAEFGPVTFPAYAGATAGIRSLTDVFRPHDVDVEIAQMARTHPQKLASVIERALKGSEVARPDPKPLPQPRFRSREEYLEWMSQS